MKLRVVFRSFCIGFLNRIVFTALYELNGLLIFVVKVSNTSNVNMEWNIHCGRGRYSTVCVMASFYVREI